MAGLNRIDLVFLNRVSVEYAKDHLPNGEQIRYDITHLMGIINQMEGEIKKILKENT